MGDRSLPRVNKHVAARNHNYAYALHRKNVEKSKPSINVAPPKKHQHLALQLKRKQLAAERMAKVERENIYLLEKMRRIMVEPQTVVDPPFSKGSLNREARKRTMIKIMNENEALLKRIQKRPASYNVKTWEKDYADKEKIMYNISEYPYQPTHPSSRQKRLPHMPRSAGGELRRKRLGNGKGRPRSTGPASRRNQAASTCVFSRGDIEIDGIDSIVSVYEINAPGKPFQLQIAALDTENNLSNKRPVMIKMSDLRVRFKANLDILKPENTENLVHELLALFTFGPDPKSPGKAIQLMFKPEKPSSARKASSKKRSAKKKIDTGVVIPLSLRVACSGLAGDAPAKVIAKIKTTNESTYATVGTTEELQDDSPSFAKIFQIDAYEKVDRELLLQAVLGGEVLGEVTIGLKQYQALPTGKIELGLLKDGSPVGAKIVLSSAEEEEERVSSGSDSARRKAATICRGGIDIDGISFLYSVVDEDNKWSFQMYHQKTTKTIAVPVLVSDFPALSKKLNSSISLEFGDDKVKKKPFAELLLPLFTTNGKADNDLQIEFNKNSTNVRFECKDLQGANEAEVAPFVRISKVSADKETVVGTGAMKRGTDGAFTNELCLPNKIYSYTVRLYDVAADQKITDDDLIAVAELTAAQIDSAIDSPATLELKTSDGATVAKSSMTILQV